MTTSSEAKRQLAHLCEGVLFRSEIDAPVTPFSYPAEGSSALGEPQLRHALKLETDTPIEVLEFASYFAARTREREGQDSMQRETIRRTRALAEWMQAHLSDLRVYKIGHLNYDIYALGKTSDSSWEGIHTQTQET